jgi:uncharacterized protein (TIGR03382 family)
LPGDKAANVSWQQSTGAPIAEYYRVEATSIGTTIDPGGFHLGPAVTGTKFRLGGLVNGGTYVVGVRAFSTADNPSEVTTTIVSPEPVADFWDEYKAAGGQETGGCSSGIAGPVGLAVLAGTLLLVRRRK